MTFKLRYIVTKGVYMNYIWSKGERWRDDQGVRAAETQFLRVDTLISSITLDQELYTDSNKNNTSQSEE